MASSYSELKIQLMTTGENDGTWGDITNANYLAFQQAISGLGGVVFANANIVLPFTDTNAPQAARAYRLFMSGPTGGPRTLTVPDFPNGKSYLAYNATADIITVKTAAGAGVAVPVGRSMLLTVDNGGVSEQISYITNLVTNNFTATGNISAPKVNVGAGGLFCAGGAFVSGNQALWFRTNDANIENPVSTRWSMSANPAGFDLYFNSYDDAGAYVESPLGIQRSTGILLSKAVSVGSTITVAGRGTFGELSVTGAAGFTGPVAFSSNFYFRAAGGTGIFDGSRTRWSIDGYDNIALNAFDDTGAYSYTPFYITRASRRTSIAYGLDVAGTFFCNSNGTFSGTLSVGDNFTGPNVGWTPRGVASTRISTFLVGADGAGNTGSDLYFYCHDNNGGGLSSAAYIKRSSQRFIFINGFSVEVASNVGTAVEQIRIDGLSRWAWNTAAGTGQLSLFCINTSGVPVAENIRFSLDGTSQFPYSLPLGPSGTPVGLQRLAPRIFTANADIEMASVDSVQIARPGCNRFRTTSPASHPELFDGFHCKLVNLSGSNLSVREALGVTLHWVDGSGNHVTGHRTMRQGAVAEVLYVDGDWLIFGNGVS